MIPHLEMAQHYWNVICVKYPDKPWERVQWRSWSGDWVTQMNGHPNWLPQFNYRLLPDTIKVVDIELPEPLRVEPEEGARVYSVLDASSYGQAMPMNYHPKAAYSKWLFDNGFLHATQEAAQAWLYYFAKLARGE
jgi:hypothetical protein